MPEIHCPNAACSATFRYSNDQAGQRVRCRPCSTTFDLPSATNAATNGAAIAATPTSGRPTTPTSIGRFRIRRPLGEGGFGMVYLAFDPQLDREVALKIPRPGTLNSAQRVRRFREDARSAAQLRHPHIVPIYDAGEVDGQHFIASAYVEGGTLAKAVKGGALDIKYAIEVVRDLAEALAYAHSQAVVHRDVKPDNVLMDNDGEPHLIDFGLAHRGGGPEAAPVATGDPDDDSDAALRTRAGAVTGTPAYMSPEQAEGRGHEASEAMDQYSLGVVLYELLTGKRPFNGTQEAVLLQQINTPPVPLREHRPEIPLDVEAICLRCLEKKAEDRYVSCAALAEDLRCWLNDEAVTARPPKVLERLQRWRRREPALAIAVLVTTLCLLLLVTVMAFSGWQLSVAKQHADELRIEADKNRDDVVEANKKLKEHQDQLEENQVKLKIEIKQKEVAKGEAIVETEKAIAAGKETKVALKQAEALAISEKKAREEVDRQFKEANRTGYLNSIVLAEHDLREVQIDRARKRLAEAEELIGKENVGWEWHHLMGECSRRKTRSRSISTMAFWPNEKGPIDPWLAWANDDNEVVFRKQIAVPGVADIFKIKANEPIRSLAFSADGSTLAVGCDNGRVVVWPMLNRGAMTVFETNRLNGSVTAIALDRVGKKMLCGMSDGRVLYWEDLRQANPLVLPTEHLSEIRSVAFDLTYKKVISVCQTNHFVIRDLTTKVIEDSYNSMTAAASQQQGKYFHLAREGGRVVVYNVTVIAPDKPPKVEQLVEYSDHEIDVVRMIGSYSDRVASLDRSGMLPRVWEAKMTKVIDDKYATRSVGSCALSRMGSQLAWMPDNQTVRMKLLDGSALLRYRFADGLNASAAGDDLAQLADYREFTHTVAYAPLKTTLRMASVSSVTRGATAEAGEMVVWDTSTGERIKPFPDEKNPLWAVDIAPGGQIAYGGKAASLYLLDPELRSPVKIDERAYNPVNVVRFNPNPKHALLASAHTDGVVHVWNTTTRSRVNGIVPDGLAKNIVALAWNSAGDRLICGDDNGQLTWTDINFTKKESIKGAHAGRIWSVVSVTVNGEEMILSAGADGTIKVWKVGDPVPVTTLKSHGQPVLALAVSPDGTRLASAGLDNTIRLWEIPTWREVVAIPSKAGLRSGLAFRPDGKELAVATVSGILRLNATPMPR